MQPFPTDRYAVRIRRLADLSQRDLAHRVGISRSVIQRIESARGDVSVGAFVKMLAVVDLRLVVVDRDGHEVEPVSDELVRDNAGRRFPAHLDVDPPDVVPPLRRLMPRYDRPPARGWYRHRPERDRLRAVAGHPGDHPTLTELAVRDDERARLRREEAARRRPPVWTLEDCECETECWLGTACVPDCPCQCETGPDPNSA